MVDADPAGLARYGFLEDPFVDSPDERFTYRSASLTRAVDAVLHGIASGEQLIVVTGEPGIGKTTLCMELSRQIASGPAQDVASRIAVIDDADLLGWGRLRECVRSCGGSGEPPVQTILVGRPQLDERLEHAGCAEHPIRHIELAPLDESEIQAYVDRRIWVARGGIATLRDAIADGEHPTSRSFVSGPIFSARVIRQFAAESGGNPRTVNAMCAEALDRAAARQATRITGESVGPPAVRLFSLRQLAWCAAGLAVAALALVSSFAAKSSLGRSTAAGATRSVTSNESFDAFRRRTLQRAAELAAVPDVNELLRIRETVVSRGHESSDGDQAIAILLKQIDGMTNDARARQLAVDRRQLLEYSKQR